MDQVPANVKKQKDDADELLRLLEEKGAGATPPGPPAEPAPAAPQPPATTPKPSEGIPPASAAAAPEAVPVTEDPVEMKRQITELTAAIDTLQAELAKVQHHESVLEGKLKTEGPEFARQIREQKAEIERLTAEVEAIRKTAPAKTDESIALTDLDKQVMDELGMEEPAYRLFIKRFGPQAVAPKAPVPAATSPEPPAQPASAPTDQPAPTAITPARAAFNLSMDVKARGWQEARKNPKFAEFVRNTAEATSGRPLIEILAEADATLNSNVVARIYQEFFKTDVPAPTEVPAKPSREAAPTSQKGGSGEPVAQEIWTVERMTKFENDVATGKIKMGSPEYIRLKTSRDEALDKATYPSR